MTVKFPLAVVITGQDVSLSSTLGKADMRIRATGQLATQVGRALTVGLTLPLVGVGVAAVRTGTAVQTNMLSIRAAAALTADQTEELHKAARGYSDLGVGVKDATEGMLAYAKAGLSATQITSAMRPTILLAKSAGKDFGEVAEGVVNIMSGYRKEFSETAMVSDQLTFATDATTNDLTDLLEAFKEGGPVARSLHQEFSTTAATLALLGQNGLKGSKGGTAMAGMLARLVNLAPEAQKRLVALKIDPKSLTDSRGGLKDMADIIQVLEDHGAQAADVLEIFGRNAGPGMLALLGAGSSAVRKLSKDLDGAGGSSMRKYAMVASGAAGAEERLTASLQNLADTIARSGLLDTVTRLVDRVDHWTKAFDGLSPAVQDTIVKVGFAAAVVGPFLSMFGSAIKIYETAKALRLIAAAQTLVGTTAAAATPKVAGLSAAGSAGGFAGIARLLGPAAAAAFLLNADNPDERGAQQRESLAHARLKAIGTEAGINPYHDWMAPPNSGQMEQRIAELQRSGFGKSREFQRLEVIFKNAPQGTRVNATAGTNVDVDVGYAMSTP